MEGHGDHWSCLGETKAVIPQFINLLFGDDATIRVGPDVSVVPENGEPRQEQLISMSCPQKDLGALGIYVLDSQTNPKTIKLWSLFPFATKGVSYTITIDEIEEWKNGVEARVSGETEEGAWFGFFDTHYHLNRERYAIGKSYEFSLAAVAYSLEVVAPEPVIISDPEQIRIRQEVFAESGVEVPLNADGHIELHMAGAAILLPIEEWDISDYRFQAPVRDVSSFELEGQIIYAVRATVMIVDDKDIDLIIYTPEHALKAAPPKPGDDVAGSLWVQGYMRDKARHDAR